MCIAIYKPEGVKMPELSIFENCWESNPDGAGYAVRKDGQCHIHKGIMDWKDFEKVYDSQLKKLNGYDVLIHFRIHTHGGVNKENTHPFPITNNVKQLGKTYTVCPRCMIHNGVLPITPRKNSISDTAEMALRIAESGLTSDKVENLIGELIGTNKIALMNGVKVYLMGDWIKDKGVYYSNRTYSYSIYSGGYWGKGIVSTNEWWKEYGYDSYEDYRRDWSDALYKNRTHYGVDEEKFIDEYTEGDEDFMAYVIANEPEWESYSADQKEEIYNAYYGAYYEMEESGQMFAKNITERELDEYYESDAGILFKHYVEDHYQHHWDEYSYDTKQALWNEFKKNFKLNVESTAAKK